MSITTELDRALALARVRGLQPRYFWLNHEGEAELKAAASTYAHFGHAGGRPDERVLYRGVAVHVDHASRRWQLDVSDGGWIGEDHIDIDMPAHDPNMVELPRNPVDEKIDGLSSAARALIEGWAFDQGKPIERFFATTPHLEELHDLGLIEATGNESGGGDGVNLTFDGWNASERIPCGIYERHKRIEEGRQARDQALEAIPGWGEF